MANKDNPFAKFKASKKKPKSTAPSSSWLSTKKRGRDDDQIERDKQAVLETRKKIRSKGAAQKTGQKKTPRQSKSKSNSRSSNNNRKGPRRKYDELSDVDDDDDDDDSFIVDEGEEVEEEFMDESEEEEEEEIDIFDDDDDDDSDGFGDGEEHVGISDDDDDDDDDDNESIEEINSSPEKKVARSTNLKRHRQKDSRNTVATQSQKISIQDSSVLELNSVKTPTNTTTSIHKKRNSRKTGKVAKSALNTVKDVFLSSSDDDDDDEDLFHSTTAHPKMKPTTSNYFQNASTKKTSNNNSISKGAKLENESDIDVLSPIFTKKSRKIKSLQFSSDEDDDDDDDGEGNDNNVKQISQKQTENRKSTKQNDMFLSNTDSEADDSNDGGAGFDRNELDETIALSLGLENSKKIVYKDDLEEKNEESDADDIDDGAEVDAYESPDEDELEANNVLEAANKLSAHIVSVLRTWCIGGDTNVKNDTANATKGLIVNGALSFGAINKEDSTLVGEEKKSEEEEEVKRSEESNWISNEEMVKVCPDIILKDYQLIGVNWMALLHNLTFEMESKVKGKRKKIDKRGRNVNGVLADEMGLGKTVQTIAFLAWLKHNYRLNRKQVTESDPMLIDSDDEQGDIHDDNSNDHKPHIIIVPASVLSNWEREFNRFCPDMKVVRYHGSMTERREIKDMLRAYLPKKKGKRKGQSKLDVVLTTFSYFSSEKQDDRSFLRKFDWNYMVVDEAHCLKNPKGARYRNMDRFNTQRRLLLTGTPVQNNAKELMSLLCFLMPLFTKEASGFDDEDGNDGGERMLEHFVRQEHLKDKKGITNEKVSQEEAYAKLKQLFAPFVLRREKMDVLKQWLPPKKKQIEWVPFETQSRNVYDSILQRHIRDKKNGSEKARTHIFTELRKAANHPLLLRTRHLSEDACEHLSKHLFMYGYFGEHETCTQVLVKNELQKFSDYDIHCAASTLIDENHIRSKELERYTLAQDDLFCSPKFRRLKTLLPQLVDAGHRILIFSQWTRCLDLLSCLLDTQSLAYLRLDGSTAITERQILIDEFTNDKSINVFLLSTRAGGMGINLTAADTCILHDLDFNPFNDIQAEDRCHRIGQQKPVTIIKMITEDTVDSDIYKMQERKSQMNEAILDSNSKARKKKNQDSEEMNNILDLAVSRYQDGK